MTEVVFAYNTFIVKIPIFSIWPPSAILNIRKYTIVSELHLIYYIISFLVSIDVKSTEIKHTDITKNVYSCMLEIMWIFAHF